MSPTPRAAAADEWARARADYERGDATASDLARRLEVARSTVARDIARERWRQPAEGGAPPALSGAKAVQPPAPAVAPAGKSAGQGATHAQPSDNAAPPGLAERLAGDDDSDPFDTSTPEGRRRLLDAAWGRRRGAELDAWLDEQVEELAEQRAERLAYRPLGWIRRAPW